MFLLYVCMCLVPEVVRRGHQIHSLAQIIISIIENTLKIKRAETDDFSVCWEWNLEL